MPEKCNWRLYQICGISLNTCFQYLYIWFYTLNGVVKFFKASSHFQNPPGPKKHHLHMHSNFQPGREGSGLLEKGLQWSYPVPVINRHHHHRHHHHQRCIAIIAIDLILLFSFSSSQYQRFVWRLVRLKTNEQMYFKIFKILILKMA